MAYRAVVTIQGTAPLSQSRQHFAEKNEGESHDAYDKRTWREKCSTDAAGNVHVPAMAFKQAMDMAAKRLAIPDPDNRRANFTKYFVSDVICEANMPIGIHKDAMPSITISANADGVRGSGKRVPRIFPQTPTWGGVTTFLIMEAKITPKIFEHVLEYAGRSIGIGQFRPERGGLNGRFEVPLDEKGKLRIKYEEV